MSEPVEVRHSRVVRVVLPVDGAAMGLVSMALLDEKELLDDEGNEKLLNTHGEHLIERVNDTVRVPHPNLLVKLDGYYIIEINKVVDYYGWGDRHAKLLVSRMPDNPDEEKYRKGMKMEGLYLLGDPTYLRKSEDFIREYFKYQKENDYPDQLLYRNEDDTVITAFSCTSGLGDGGYMAHIIYDTDTNVASCIQVEFLFPEEDYDLD